MQEIGRIIGRYLFPILLIALGITLLSISSGQTNLYKIGGVGILLVGALGFLYVKGLISLKIQMIITGIVAVGAIYFSVMDYEVIKEELLNEKHRQKVKVHVVQRLKDIRKVEVAHKKEKGYYAASFDSLMHFLDNGKLTVIKKLGAFPDSASTDELAREAGIIQKMPEGMTDAEVAAAGIIVRDTLLVPVKPNIFDADDAKNRKTVLYTDSLPYVPFGNHMYSIQTGTVESGGVTQQTLLIMDPDPFDKQFMIGSLNEASTSGNWKD